MIKFNNFHSLGAEGPLDGFRPWVAVVLGSELRLGCPSTLVLVFSSRFARSGQLKAAPGPLRTAQRSSSSIQTPVTKLQSEGLVTLFLRYFRFLR